MASYKLFPDFLCINLYIRSLEALRPGELVELGQRQILLQHLNLGELLGLADLLC